MATLCTNCGKPLPKDDAKFCNNCGTLVPSHPFSSRSTTSGPQTFQDSENARKELSRPPLREHIAQLPPSPARPTRRFTQDEPPTWMTHLNDTASNQPSSDPGNAGNTPVTTPSQLDFPVAEPAIRPGSAARELRVKVWQSEEPLSSPDLSKAAPQPITADDMDALPTSPLVASSSSTPLQQQSNTVLSQSTTPVQNDYLDELERMDTAHLASSQQPSPARPDRQVSYLGFDQPFAASWQQRPVPTRDATSVIDTRHETPAPQRSMSRPAQPISASVSRAASERQLQQTPLPSVAAPSPTLKGKKGRKPVVLIGGLLAILLIGAIGIWVAMAQPFSIPLISQPQQSFTNSQLAFSLQYPRGWVARVNTGTSTSVFSDSSDTAQVTVSVTAANGQDAGQIVNQLANQAKLTNIKTGTQAFGGATWQQVQGNISLSGANYLETMLATVHNNRLYTIIQDAPSSTYGQEEQIVFSPMRTSFQFN